MGGCCESRSIVPDGEDISGAMPVEGAMVAAQVDATGQQMNLRANAAGQLLVAATVVIVPTSFTELNDSAAFLAATPYAKTYTPPESTWQSLAIRCTGLTVGASVTVDISVIPLAGAVFTTLWKTITGVADASGNFSSFQSLCQLGFDGGAALKIAATTASVAVAGTLKTAFTYGA